MIGASAALLVLVAATAQGAWESVWSDLERLHTKGLDAHEAEVLRARLSEVAAEHARDPRGELLRGDLELLEGRPNPALGARLAALAPGTFTPQEHWFLADLLAPGPERARAVLAALDSPDVPTQHQLVLAWNVATDEARLLRFESALPIQQRLHDRCRADWSALDLTLTLRLLGEREAVEAVFEQQIAQDGGAGAPTADLWSQRGISAMGFGDERLARDYLGRALAMGSDDAGLVLSRLDWMAGRIDVARHGFRASILNTPPPDWAWRGWGLCLLPPAHAAPARKSSSPSSP